MEAINTKLMKIGKIILINRHDFRDVAQSGSALHWGCSGRRFKSGHPDHLITQLIKFFILEEALRDSFDLFDITNSSLVFGFRPILFGEV